MKTYNLKDIKLHTIIFTVVIVIAIILGLLSVVNQILQLDLIDKIQSGYFTDPVELQQQAQSNDVRQNSLVLPSIVFNFGSLAALMFWLFRLSANSIIVCQKKLDYTPSWAIWSFFIPVASLYLPFAMIKELWLANKYISTDDKQRYPLFILVWWIFYIFSNIYSLILNRLATSPETIEELRNITMHLTFALSLEIIVKIGSIVLVLVITNYHSQRISAYQNDLSYKAVSEGANF